jgi:hypothetical protein
MKSRMIMKNDYIGLYRKVQLKKKISAVEQTRINELEKFLNYRDLI